MIEDVPNRIKAKSVPRPGRWVSAAILALFAVAALHSITTNPRFDWAIVGAYIRDVKVIRGVGWTLILTVCSMIVGVTLAVILAVMRRSDNPILRGISG